MAIREVLQFPDPRLKRKSEPIREITDAHRELAAEMCQVMYDEPGIGLAAPQIGEPIRLIEGKITWNEGCLSVPDYNADVQRAERIHLQGLDIEGQPIEEHAEGLRAVCFQHEIDHLDGILFIDRISRLKRSMYVNKRKKQLALEASEASDGRAPL